MSTLSPELEQRIRELSSMIGLAIAAVRCDSSIPTGSYEDSLRALVEQAQAEGCPHGGDCGCAISSRHEWYVAFCRERQAQAEERREHDKELLELRERQNRIRLAAVADAQAEALQSLAAKADTEDIRDWVLFHAQERKQP